MEWEPEALEKVRRIPFFARRLATAKIEEFAAGKGMPVVTVEAVDEAKRAFFKRTGTDTKELLRLMKDVPAPPHEDEGKRTGAEARAPGGNGGTGGAHDRKNLYEVSGCNDEHLCPFSLLDARSLVQNLEKVLEESDITEALVKRIEGPVLFHHAFRISVSECPNACSQPQIKDFGVIAESLPGPGEGVCTNCGLCVQECREAAITLTETGPAIKYNKCVRCGACAAVCPSGALVTKKTGYSVLVGGRLGRHPRFGARILEMTDEEAVPKALRAVVRVYIEKGEGNERFGAMTDRLGIEYMKTEIRNALR